MNTQANAVVDTTRDYYDSSDADNFYFHIWGGEDIHVGIYETPDEPIRDASHRTVLRMLASLGPITPQTAVLDIGSGYCGSSRVIARQFGCQVTALNLSSTQNVRARELNAKHGLADRIEVIDGSFEDMPFEAASFDVIWCQDSILHSARRQTVFNEVDRLLKSGGRFIFTDPMQIDGVDPKVLEPVLARIHLPSMGSVTTYQGYAETLGWKTLAIDSMPEQLTQHYGNVLAELESRSQELASHCSADYITRMKAGLNHWVTAGKNKALDWGILYFQKP
ncbi:MAG: SAM-dependent methyltransferase [Panacagrimonas sp.]